MAKAQGQKKKNQTKLTNAQKHRASVDLLPSTWKKIKLTAVDKNSTPKKVIESFVEEKFK